MSTRAERQIENIRFIRSDPVGGHALSVLDIIDAKISSLFTLTSILVGAVLIIASQPGEYMSASVMGVEFRQIHFVGAALVTSVTSALFALSCLWIINLAKICEIAPDNAAVITKISKIRDSRLARYKLSFLLTVLTLPLTIAAVAFSLFPATAPE